MLVLLIVTAVLNVWIYDRTFNDSSTTSCPPTCELRIVQNYINVDGTNWFYLGNACIRHDDQEFCHVPKFPRFPSSADAYEVGSDPLGDYERYLEETIQEEWELSYQRYPKDPTTMVFRQTFKQDLNHTAYPASSARASAEQGLATRFPSLIIGMNVPNEKMGYLQLSGHMAGQASYTIGPISDLKDQQQNQNALASGPLALFTEQCVLIISPASEFMSTSAILRDNELVPKQEYGIGVMGSVTSIPKGHQVTTILSSSPLRPSGGVIVPDGIRQAFSKWGAKLMTYYQTQRPTQDTTRDYLQYNTDNGAFYYYQTEPNQTYQETILDIKAHVDKIGLPIRNWLADSWWYFKGKGKGVSEWKARPDIFPDGFAHVTNVTQWPIVAHNRYWAPDTKYARVNGGDYDFAVETKVALPLETRFWNDLFQTAKTWGLTVYEQDWLDVQMHDMDYLLERVDSGRTWLLQMGQAAKANGIPMQWCMAYPRHILQSLQVDYVTQARASEDYQPSRGQQNWDIGISSMFTAALRIAPLKDTFWSSTAPQHNPKYDKNQEVTPRLHAVISTYSTGAVSPSDSIGHLDVDLLMRSCAQDGRLLKPDLPAVATDTTILEAGGIILGPQPTNTSRRHVWSTMTQLLGYTYTYILAIESPSFNLTREDLYGETRYSLECIAWELDTEFSPTSLPLTVPPSTETSFHVYATAPILPNGFCFLGEAETKWTPVSQSRFSMFTVSTKDFTVLVHGAPSEVVQLVIRTPKKLFVKVACTIPAAGTILFSSQAMACAA